MSLLSFSPIFFSNSSQPHKNPLYNCHTTFTICVYINTFYDCFNNIQHQAMAFQVREFDFQAEQQDFLWKFKLGNINSSQLDFYSQQVASRSLLHLSQDFVSQVDQAYEKKNRKPEEKDRIIRKLTEKTIKSLKVNLESFARDIEEEVSEVEAYFNKSLVDQAVKDKVKEKCKRWIIATWLSLKPEQFFKTTDKYMQSFIKDGKKLNPDFEILNELYVVTIGDDFNEKEQDSRQYNDNLILIDINLSIDDKYLSESFLWDSENISNIRIKSFANHFLKDILAQNGIQLQKQQLQQLQKQARTQIRTQILYKTLLKKYASLLLNFSSMDIPTEAKEYLIPISLKLLSSNNTNLFQDSFEWDILNESNNVEQFVEGLLQDYSLPQKYYAELCYKIRTQINSQLEWKFDLLVKTFKSIHKDRQSPKLNTQTISVLRKNLAFAMDVNLPSGDDKYKLNSNIYFNNSQLFSLLSRNLDILPEEFQQILMCKQPKNPEKQPQKISKEQSNEVLKKSSVSLQNNPYIPSFCGTHNLHNVWRKALLK